MSKITEELIEDSDITDQEKFNRKIIDNPKMIFRVPVVFKYFDFLQKKSYLSLSLDRLLIRLIYSSGFKVGIPSAEATATLITAEELPLLAIV